MFCNILSHLLLTRGPNLRNFIALIEKGLPIAKQIEAADLERAQLFSEFSFLRDYWYSLGKNNAAKRDLIVELLATIPLLAHHTSTSLPTEISEFNELFMGARGRKIERDIAFPGSWSVVTLAARFGGNATEFREFCRFKWAFNIKPDIVILVPEFSSICIETKLESSEGHNPAGSQEIGIFNNIFGDRKGRVRQLELQQYLFATLLQHPCQCVSIGRKPINTDPSIIFISWDEIFSRLDVNQPLPFVRELILDNQYIR